MGSGRGEMWVGWVEVKQREGTRGEEGGATEIGM